MKKLLTNTITFIAEILALILGALWYANTKDYEPLILMILSISTLITSWLLKTSANPNLEIKIILTGKGQKPIQPSSKTPRTNEGNFFMEIGNIIGKREIFWNYTVKIINNSNLTAFKPELFVIKEFAYLDFVGSLDINSPLKGTESADLEINFMKWTDGTESEREQDYSPKYPPEILNGFQLIIKYASENGSILFNQFQFSEGIELNNKKGKLPKNFIKTQQPVWN